MSKRNVHYRYRSAITGRFVKPAYAARFPKRTVRERATRKA